VGTTPGFPIKRETLREESQLGGWACPAWPLRVFPMTQDVVLEAPVEVLLFREDVIDDARQLEGDQGARDPDRLLAALALKNARISGLYCTARMLA